MSHCNFVKTYLLPDWSKSTKKKTSVKKGVDPIFNETIKIVTIITCLLVARYSSVILWFNL